MDTPFFLILLFISVFIERSVDAHSNSILRFNPSGMFKILQVADMHYANGKSTACLDVLPAQVSGCTDLNTTAFLNRMIHAEKPDLIVFTGDNIFGRDVKVVEESLRAAFSPAITSGIPWAVVLGNHDQESTLSRKGLMKYIVKLSGSISRVNPTTKYHIDGFGNYNLEIYGTEGSQLANKSVLNLFFLDSGDYSTISSVSGYNWIKLSQQLWFQRTSSELKTLYTSAPEAQSTAAPGLAFFHIPLQEYAVFGASNMTGEKQEGISSASANSGFFTTLVESGDVKAVFLGHDHLNDFCGRRSGICLCYGGGFGYHAYGKAGWARRARVIVASLENQGNGWRAVKSVKTWKRLDDHQLSRIDVQMLWDKPSASL